MSVVIGGTDWDIINQALTTSYTEVTYTKPVKNFLVQGRGDVEQPDISNQ